MVYIFIAMVFYAVAIVFSTVASRHLNTNLSAGMINLVSAILPVAVALPVITRKSLSTQKFGLIMAVLAGTCIAIFAMALTKSYSVNKVGVVAPLVFGGALFLSTFMSYFFLKEKITPIQGVGFLFLAVGLGLVVYARATGR